MSRAQAVILAILIGLVALVFMAIIVLLIFPPERLFRPAPPPVPSPPAPLAATPTATFPNFLPTENPETPTVEPTATYTRVPTVTPRPSRTPSPTTQFALPTPFVRPSETPTPVPTLPPAPTSTPTSGPSPTLIPRQYSVSFEADEETIEEGDCTDLRWEVQGASSITLDGRPVEPSGRKEVCPRQNTAYRLTIQLPNSAALETKTVEIKVEKKADNDNDD